MTIGTDPRSVLDPFVEEPGSGMHIDLTLEDTKQIHLFYN